MPRTKPPEERRADLLAAGEALFVAKGVARTTLEDITTGASVSKGLFYQYYRSKQDLVFALQERFFSEFAERVRTAVQRHPHWPGKLDACVQACFDSFQGQQELHEVLFLHTGHPAEAPDHPGAHHLLVETIATLLAEGASAGAFHLDDIEATAVLLFSAMHAFDPAIRGDNDLAGVRLVRATQHLARRAAGVNEVALAAGRARPRH
jgi:TetR/AcrR family transcriptional regulator, transcriptional repressor for nem operon